MEHQHKSSKHEEPNEEQIDSTGWESDEQATENDSIENEKVAELNDKYLRLYSEFENFRRRTNRERLELIQQANKDLILAILPVIDDFDRALQVMENAGDKAAVIDGVKLIYNKLKNILQQAGLKEIEAKGNDFDPELHDAITKINASDDMKGKVVDDIQKGYLLNDKIIRHSKVVVGE